MPRGARVEVHENVQSEYLRDTRPSHRREAHRGNVARVRHAEQRTIRRTPSMIASMTTALPLGTMSKPSRKGRMNRNHSRMHICTRSYLCANGANLSYLWLLIAREDVRQAQSALELVGATPRGAYIIRVPVSGCSSPHQSVRSSASVLPFPARSGAGLTDIVYT